jgi:amidase
MNELHWWTAYGLADAIRGREVSAREALEHFVHRVESLDGPINAVVRLDLDRARADAAEADAAIARGDELGPLHGVPITVKDSYMTEGCITTSGAPQLGDFVPTEDAWPVARLREAGAIIYGKTNLPIFAGDIQSYNEVYGTTNNPHDIDRTPGGSSGGSAAALAMGFTPIELGSDIGGSIRVPAHYSGVTGHKPSFGIVPAHGQIPGLPGMLSQADLAVAGPMARTVDDLEVMLDALSGPDRWNSPAWRLELPPSRADALADFRIAAWIDDERCRVDDDTTRALTETIDAIESAGGRVDTAARPGFTLDKAFSVFGNLLFAALSGGHERGKIEHMATDESDTTIGWVKRGTAARHRDWLSDHERRLQLRERWAEFFADYDAILLPVHPRPAIPHDHSEPQWARRVDIGGRDASYLDLFPWIAPAGVAYLPAAGDGGSRGVVEGHQIDDRLRPEVLAPAVVEPIGVGERKGGGKAVGIQQALAGKHGAAHDGVD